MSGASLLACIAIACSLVVLAIAAVNLRELRRRVEWLESRHYGQMRGEVRDG